MSDRPTLRISFMDDRTIEFALPGIPGTRTQMAESIAQARTASNFLIEVDNKIMLIPFANVRSLELDRGDDSQPIPGLLSGAELIE